jgi:hypothetical protein
MLNKYTSIVIRIVSCCVVFDVFCLCFSICVVHLMVGAFLVYLGLGFLSVPSVLECTVACGAQMVPSIQSTKRARWTATYISFCEQIAREAINRGVWAQVTLFKGSLKAL